MGYYQKKTFRYDEGTAKFIANLNKLTPLENVHDFIDPKAALKTAYQKKK